MKKLILASALLFLALQASAATYYVSPGDNISSAISNLNPGDTLIFRDGRYEPIYVYCGSGAQNGSSGAPITIKAEHERHAYIEKTAAVEGISINQCNYWVVEGFRVSRVPGTPDGDGAWSGISASESEFVTIRKNLIHGMTGDQEMGISVVQTRDSVVEDNEIYENYRPWHIIVVNLDDRPPYTSVGDNIIKRNFANSRGIVQSEGGNAIGSYPSQGNIYENNITLTSDDAGGVVWADKSEGTKLFGNIGVNTNVTVAGGSASGWGGCQNEDCRNNIVAENNLGINTFGSYFYGNNQVVKNHTQIARPGGYGYQAGGGIRFNKEYPFYSANPDADFTCINCLVIGTVTAFSVRDVSFASVINPAVADNLADFSGVTPVGAVYLDDTNRDIIRSCPIFVPDSAIQLKGKGSVQGASTDIGANILKAYASTIQKPGTLSNADLWDWQATGQNRGRWIRPDGTIPATVPGVNDNWDTDLIGFHQKWLGLGNGSCPSPTQKN